MKRAAASSASSSEPPSSSSTRYPCPAHARTGCDNSWRECAIGVAARAAGAVRGVCGHVLAVTVWMCMGRASRCEIGVRSGYWVDTGPTLPHARGVQAMPAPDASQVLSVQRLHSNRASPPPHRW
eukprot:4903555-Prymnesium_polylepis.1